MIDALKRASAGRITAVIPYFGYGRTDKKDQPRVPITARLLADMITVAGANRVLDARPARRADSGLLQYPGGRADRLVLLGDYFREKRLDEPRRRLAPTSATPSARATVAELDGCARWPSSRSGASATTTIEVLNVIGNVARLPGPAGGRRDRHREQHLPGGAGGDRTWRVGGLRRLHASGPLRPRLRAPEAAARSRELVCTDTIPLPADGYPEMMTHTLRRRHHRRDDPAHPHRHQRDVDLSVAGFAVRGSRRIYPPPAPSRNGRGAYRERRMHS